MGTISFNDFLNIYLYSFLLFFLLQSFFVLISNRKYFTLKNGEKASEQEQQEFKYRYLLISNNIKGRKFLKICESLSALFSFFFLVCNFGVYAEGDYNASLVAIAETRVASLNAFLALFFLSCFMFFKIIDGVLIRKFFFQNKDGIDFYRTNEKYCSKLFLTNRLSKVEFFIKSIIFIIFIILTFNAYSVIYFY